jgi:methylase of polypeptide subunit release factors
MGISANQVGCLNTLCLTLRDSGFETSAVQAAQSTAQRLEDSLGEVALRLALERLGDERLTLALSLFAFGLPVKRVRVQDVLPGLDVAGLQELSLLEAQGDELVSAFRVFEADGLFFTADREISDSQAVPGVSPSSLLSAACTPRGNGGTMLDLGTGCGIQALLAARDFATVVATDANPRALWLTELNACLNGIKNVETRLGNWLEPVVGERFDAIVANLPYVISPDTSFMYRDAGQPGDAVSRRLLAELPHLLCDTGFATVQGNWIRQPDSRWWQGPSTSLEGSKCDAFLICFSTAAALPYALGWAAPHHRRDPHGYETTVRRWIGSYEVNGIELIDGAMVVLRRRAGSNWRRALTRRDLPPLQMSARWRPLFEAQDRLEQLTDADLWKVRMRAVPGLSVTVEADRARGGGASLIAETSLPRRRSVSRQLAELVLTLGEGSAPAEVAHDTALARSDLRPLVKLGFLDLLED